MTAAANSRRNRFSERSKECYSACVKRAVLVSTSAATSRGPRRSPISRWRGLSVVACCLGLSSFACSSGQLAQQGPSDTLRAYSEALTQGRVDDAYRMLSEEAQRSMSIEAYRRSVRENPDDALEVARSIARPASDPVVTATVTLPSGDQLELSYEGGKWRVDSAAVDLYGQATPRQALAGFLRAFERGRYGVLMRYIPDADRAGAPPSVPAGDGDAAANGAPPGRNLSVPLTEAKLKTAWEGPQKERMSRVVQAIKAAFPTATIEETGDAAAMSYGAGGTLLFVREHGVWKIKDF